MHDGLSEAAKHQMIQRNAEEWRQRRAAGLGHRPLFLLRLIIFLFIVGFMVFGFIEAFSDPMVSDPSFRR